MSHRVRSCGERDVLFEQHEKDQQIRDEEQVGWYAAAMVAGRLTARLEAIRHARLL
jgi:hypothetical protein